MQQRKVRTCWHDIEEERELSDHSQLASPRPEAVAEMEMQAQAGQPPPTAWQNAANGKREPLTEGKWPCIGYNGIPCYS